MKRRVILLGPPGSGKGTIASRLEARTGLRHLSSGQLLRREVSEKTEIGEQVKGLLGKGKFVPDDVVFGLMERWLRETVLENGFLLDGFPRNLPQGERLDEWLDKRKKPVETVLLLRCSAEVLLQRLTGRRHCSVCGKIYHARSMAPLVADRCDVCLGKLVQRDDDTIPVVRRRLEIYERNTEPLIHYYRGQEKLAELDSDQPAERVVNEASDLLQR